MNKKVIRTVSALIYTNEGKVLLHKHPRFGMYMGAGGHVEQNEHELQTLLREVREETGLDLSQKLDSYNEILDYQRTSIKPPDSIVVIELDSGDAVLIDHTYYIRAPFGMENLPIKTENENIEFKWIEIDYALNCLSMFEDTYKQINDIADKLYEERMIMSW